MSTRESEDKAVKDAARVFPCIMSNESNVSSPGAVAVAATRKPSPTDQRIAEKSGISLSYSGGLSLAPTSSYFSKNNTEKEESKSPSTNIPGGVPASSFPFEIPHLSTEKLFVKESDKQQERRSPNAFLKPGAVATTADTDIAAEYKEHQLGLSIASALSGDARQAGQPKSPPVMDKSEFVLSVKNFDSSKEEAPLEEQYPAKARGQEMLASVGGPELEIDVYDPEANNSGLAVAKPVEEGEEDSYIANAVEYDPDAKPNSYHRRRRFRFYALLGIFALLAASAGAVLGVLLSDSVSDSSQSTVTYRETLGIQSHVERLVGNEVLEDPMSPYSQALSWITHNDSMELLPESENFVQRYILAYLYFGTTEKGPWRSCNPPEAGGNDTTCTYFSLVSVYPENYSEEIGKGRWLSSLHECSWAAISCDDNQQVREIWPVGQKLSGPFPEGIKHLQFLQAFSFIWNGLYGKLARDFIPKLPYLVDVDLQYNELTGSIPDEWLGSEPMVRLNMANNKLNGTISSKIGTLVNMRSLYLQENQISGSLPSSIGGMISLANLFLDSNNLTGSLPSEIGNLAALEMLYLQKNLLTGSIPAEIGKLSQLSEFRLHRNEALGGAIPDALFELSSLIRLDLRYCNFSGTLSSRIGELSKMDDLRLAYNPLINGPLPAELLNLTYVTEIQIQGTSLTGEIPSEFCAPDESGNFRIVSADCLANNTTMAEITCSCCASCCEPEGLNCTMFAPMP